MHSLVPTSTPSRPNSLVSQCAIPSITTIPWILALGMPSTQPPSILRQLPLSCSFHLWVDPWSPTLTLLTAYPHLCFKLGTIPANEIAYASPQSWISKKNFHPQASWNLQIKAVWNTAARLHLNEHNPSWLQKLACDIPEANWHLNNIASHPICNARRAETAPGLKKFEKLHSDKMQTTRALTTWLYALPSAGCW